MPVAFQVDIALINAAHCAFHKCKGVFNSGPDSRYCTIAAFLPGGKLVPGRGFFLDQIFCSNLPKAFGNHLADGS